MLLLKQDQVDPESRDNNGRTPLAYAAEAGSRVTLKLLLEQGKVNPEWRDNFGRTLLSLAPRGVGEK